MREIHITERDAGQRLDKYLAKLFNQAPKSFVYKMLRKKNIKLNGLRAEGAERLQVGDFIRLYLSDGTIGGFSQPKSVNARAGGLDIVFENTHILVCAKPPGILSQPEKAGDNDTMVDRLLRYLYEEGAYDLAGTFTPSVCNRLDRNTSGLLICGKTLAGAQAVGEALRSRTISKTYMAIAAGCIDRPMRLEGYHQKDEAANHVTIAASPPGKPVVTEIVPLKTNDKLMLTLLEVHLVTGRAHQIRAHLQSIGHPLIGDNKYGNAEMNRFYRQRFNIDRQMLHAGLLVFQADAGVLEPLRGQVMEAKLPYDMQRLIDSIE